MANHEIPGCPHLAAATGQPASSRALDAADGQRLMRSSEVDRECEAEHPLAQILAWVRDYLALPHPELGRRGAVCPFVPDALKVDSIQLAEVADGEATLESIAGVIAAYRDLFLVTEPTDGPGAFQKAFLIVFSSLAATQGGSALVDKVQYRLKRYFVERGLMLGEFHSENQSPGLRNPDFRPLRSPIPMLAIRHMVDSDLPFLARADYPAGDRAAFLRAFLYRLGSGLSLSRFEQAMNDLVRAEIEVWKASASDTERAPRQEYALSALGAAT